jgi:glycosyltransferase involved in cell wall biosynthesis
VTHRKGHDRLLRLLPDLLEQVPSVRIVVVGQADNDVDQKYERDLLHKDHSHVQFLGQREDVPSLMPSFDILAVPSRHEGMGLVILEAMACGLPVVGARAGGIPEVVVDGETGLLFDGDDAEGFCKALVRLCRDRELRTAMGRAGRLRVEQHFQRETQIRKVIDLLLGLCKGHRSSR